MDRESAREGGAAVSALIEYLISGVAVGCTFALLGSGFVVIFRVTGFINFAQGTFAVVAGFVAAAALTAHLPHGVAELLGILTAGATGLVIGLLAVGRRGGGLASALIVTLGAAVAAYAPEVLLWGDQPRSFGGLPGSFSLAGATLQYQYLLIIGVTLLLFVLLWAFFRYTYVGKGLTACSSNPYAAAVVGIGVRKMGITAFLLGGFLGGIAGVLLTPLQSVSFDSDINLAIGGFAAAIFGGLMSFDRALVGGLVLGVAESLVAGYFAASYETIVALVLMLGLMTWLAIRQRDTADAEDVASTSGGGVHRLIPRPVRVGALAVAAIGTFLLPLTLSQANITVYVTAGVYLIAAVGLSLLMGYAGQVSAGQAVFLAIGAYTAAVATLHGVPSLVAFVAAPVVAGAFAALVGIPLLRMRGHYLAFATIAVQLVVLAVISNVSFLGGALGLSGIPPLGVGNAAITSLRGYAWLTWAAAILTVIVIHNVIKSRSGRALRALSSSEIGAEAASVNVGGHKLAVFVIAAAAAGTAGAIYAFFLTSITPDAFPVTLSIELIVMVIIGGLGSLGGAVVGAVGIVVLLQQFNQLGTAAGMPSYMPAVFSYAAYGLLLLVFVVALPQGLVPGISDWLSRKLSRTVPGPATPAEEIPSAVAAPSPKP